MVVLNDCKNGRLYVNVGFNDRNLVKALGGMFDSDYKKWYLLHDVSKSELLILINMKNGDNFIVTFPKYIGKSNALWDRSEIIPLFDNYVKPKYCSKCGNALVAIGRSRKNGKSHYDWISRSSHKTCWQMIPELSDDYDIYTGKLKK